MKVIHYIASLCVVSLFVFTGCVEPFELPETAPDDSLLVVDGHINVELKQAVVKLTRTQNLNEAGAPPLETGAQVSVETEQGENLPLIVQPDGRFLASGIAVAYGKKYRLRIKTRNGKEYLSAFVSAQRTPAIDSVTWNVEREGVQIKVNTHDPNNSTRYYRWEYEETHEYDADMLSLWVYERGQLRWRTREEMIYTCWKQENSKNIYLGSTTQLAEDAVRDFALAFNLGTSGKFTKKYSILVKQSGISREAFDYWQMLKKNTENVGSLFDAQPSLVTGNISRVDSNPEEPVFGYFSVRSMSTSRIFISVTQLKALGIRRPFQDCVREDIGIRRLGEYVGNSNRLVLDETEPNVYGVTTAACADCRLQGGINRKPDYWE